MEGLSSDDSVDLCSILWDLLVSEKYNEAIEEIKNKKYSEYLTYNALDIVPIITKILKEKTDSAAEKCVEDILVFVAETANVKETLLVFLEEIEISQSPSYFYLLLKPLQIILLRHISKDTKSGSFTWTFNTLYTYVCQTELPENLNLEDKEILLLDCDSHVQELSNLLFQLVNFYEVFCEKVLKGELVWIGKENNSREYLSAFLLQLLHHPLSYLYTIKSEKNVECSLYRRCEEIVLLISKLIGNPFKLLNKVKSGPHLPRISPEQSDHDDEVTNKSENDVDEDISSRPKDEVSQLSLATYFHCILTENMANDFNPCVYSHSFIFLSMLPILNLLLLEKRYATIHKGVTLADVLVKQLPEMSLSADTLEAPGQCEFPHALIFVMTQCDQQKFRKNCLKTFRSYLHKFNYRGRLKLLRSLLTTVKHPGVFGIVIHEVKENLIAEQNETNEPIFISHDLKYLFTLLCTLPEQEKTDLLEWSDKIMAALNLLLFIFIRDPTNKLGVKDIIPTIKINFLDPLMKGIELSRGHYKLKLTDLMAVQRNKKSILNTTVVVGGIPLPSMPADQEKQVVQSALCSFDMMQCVLVRVEQTINN